MRCRKDLPLTSVKADRFFPAGNDSGWRTYSRKETFPANSDGRWIVDVRTPQGQLLKRMRFIVED
ncbi:MAG: DUF2914 domain-containing protein [Sphingomonadales bacterium]|nr:DUF2914 domain-containing protein [Sphingomonadales bacterium]